MASNKTLGDYISAGRHELVAFIRDSFSADALRGNTLGKTVLGVLICEREGPDDESKVRAIYKYPPRFKEDSDIMWGDFDYSAQVDSENPLAITTSFNSRDHLKAESEEYEEAKKILRGHGVY